MIKNKINNQCYIGQTTQNLEERWRQHKTSKSNCRYLKNAFQKYGIEKFKIEKIDEADSLEKLKQKEFFWINHFNSTNKEIGYNIQKGDENDNLVMHDDTKIKIVKSNKKNKLNGFSKRNSSDIKTLYMGVHFIQEKKMWAYSISFNGKKICKKR